jgi:threonine dehydrogenase-like Zn-dependent dehydrogenase
MMDANGCNTTAAAAVARLADAVELRGKRTVILAGTGPVGLRAAVLFAREGADVTLTSRAGDRARAAAERLEARFGVKAKPAEARDDRDVARVLDGAHVCLTAGAAGVTLLRRDLWAPHRTLIAMADVNAVPPTGIEGVEPADKGAERDGKRVFGALGVGSLKMKVHKACVARLFARNDEVLDLEAIYAVARAA